MSLTPHSIEDFPDHRPALTKLLRKVSAECTRCHRCVSDCAFLNQYGDPKTIADNVCSATPFSPEFSFRCNLCDRCTAVCPVGLSPKALFLEMRRECVFRGKGRFPEHERLRRYERIGTSKRFSWYALPEGCDTVFFPGCALAGSRPETTLKVFDWLRTRQPTLGIVLDCCTKPSHDLGETEHFETMFGEMIGFLRRQGVTQVLTACPSCHQVFERHAREMATLSVYTVLADAPFCGRAGFSGSVSVHDPCVARFDAATQQAVRGLIAAAGLKVHESRCSGQTTLCCGLGGGAGEIAPELAQRWQELRLRDAEGRPLVSYCASCTQVFEKQAESGYLLDLLFDAENFLTDRCRGARPPVTYFNRLRLKARLKRHMQAAVTRERDFPDSGDLSLLKRSRLFLAALLPIILGLFWLGH